MGHKHLYFLCLCERPIHVHTPTMSLSLIIQSFSSSVSDLQARLWVTAHGSGCSHIPGLFFLFFTQAKYTDRCPAPIPPAAKISLHHCPPGWPGNTVGLQLSVLGAACEMSRAICKPGPSLLFLCQVMVVGAPCGPWLGTEGYIAGVGTTGLRAPASCNLFVFCRPAWACTQIYHSHLMLDYCCACLTL